MTLKRFFPLACAVLVASGCRTGGTFKAGDGSQKIDVTWSLFSELTLTGPEQPDEETQPTPPA